MSFELEKNRGSLFKNEEKAAMPPREKEMSTQADYNGSLRIVCPHCSYDWFSWLNAWLKKSQKGKTYMSVSIQPQKQERKVEKYVPPTTSHDGDEHGEECPF